MANGMSESLPVLGEVDGRCSSHSLNSSLSRQNSSGGRFPPSTPRTSVAALSNRRTPTPTKQIALQAVKRKEERKEDFDDVDLEELNSSLRLESERSFLERERSQSSLNGVEDEKTSHKFHAKLSNGEGARPKNTHYSNHDCNVGDEPSPHKVPQKGSVTNGEEKEESSSDDSDDDSEDEQKEKRRAPNQLLMEFLGCLMEGDFPNAAKLCKMILIYEPDHAEALKFQPLIQERMELNEEMDSDDDESGSDDDEDDDDDSDGDSDDSDDSLDDDEAEDSQEEKTDSGISSAHSNCNSD